jgi:S-adenosylmethionine decarboxylase
MTGVEWVIDARRCDPARLTDTSTLADLFDGIIHDLALNPVGAPVWHVFPNTGGITGLCLLAESHLAVHTFPEHASMCLNVFCCRPRADWDVVVRLARHVGARDVDVRRVERCYASLSVLTP